MVSIELSSINYSKEKWELFVIVEVDVFVITEASIVMFLSYVGADNHSMLSHSL